MNNHYYQQNINRTDNDTLDYKMKACVISNNLLSTTSPASPIETDLLDCLSGRRIEISTYCSSRGELKKKSSSYETTIVKERIIWTDRNFSSFSSS